MSPSPDDAGPTPPALSAEEAAFRASFEKLVDFYRVSQMPVLRRAFMPAMLGFVPAGGLLIALGTSRLMPVNQDGWLTLLGVLVVALGPVWCAYTLLSSIGRDRYLAIRVDGLAIKLDEREAELLIAWDKLEDARYDEGSQTTHLTICDHPDLTLRESFAEVSLKEIARRIRDARRLSLWQRLGPGTDLR